MGFELNADGVIIAIFVCYVFFGSFFVYYHLKDAYQRLLKRGPYAPDEKETLQTSRRKD